MKWKTAFVVGWCFWGAAIAFGQAAGQTQAQADPVAPDIPGVVAGGTKVQLVKEGFQGSQTDTTAPDGSLLFTEREANRITKIDKDGKISTYLENTGKTNSLAFDPKGRLIGLQWEGAQVAVLAPTRSVLADKCDGQPFGRPDDLVIDKKGGIYFTDGGIAASATQSVAIKSGVYYVKPDGRIVKATDAVERPDGIQISPDGKLLYVGNTSGEYLIVLDIQPDGSVRNPRNFAKLEGGRQTDAGMRTGIDGMTVDDAGRLYAVTTVGVQVFSPQGQHLGTIPIGKPMQNLAFAGPDKKTLYVVGNGFVYKVQMKAQGLKGRLK